MSAPDDRSAGVPAAALGRVRAICADLPDTVEEPAWHGIRWRVRGRTFAHLLEVRDGHPPAFAAAAGTAGPLDVLTFRSAGRELRALTEGGPPFFGPLWGRGDVGLRLDGDIDWDEVRELLTDSFCLLAPKSLAALVERPGG